jgi:TolA-binding protein
MRESQYRNPIVLAVLAALSLVTFTVCFKGIRHFSENRDQDLLANLRHLSSDQIEHSRAQIAARNHSLQEKLQLSNKLEEEEVTLKKLEKEAQSLLALQESFAALKSHSDNTSRLSATLSKAETLSSSPRKDPKHLLDTLSDVIALESSGSELPSDDVLLRWSAEITRLIDQSDSPRN